MSVLNETARILHRPIVYSCRTSIVQVCDVRSEPEALVNPSNRILHRERKYMGAHECPPYQGRWTGGNRPTSFPQPSRTSYHWFELPRVCDPFSSSEDSRPCYHALILEMGRSLRLFEITIYFCWYATAPLANSYFFLFFQLGFLTRVHQWMSLPVMAMQTTVPWWHTTNRDSKHWRKNVFPAWRMERLYQYMIKYCNWSEQ